jgi:hypothetical protein
LSVEKALLAMLLRLWFHSAIRRRHSAVKFVVMRKISFWTRGLTTHGFHLNPTKMNACEFVVAASKVSFILAAHAQHSLYIMYKSHESAAAAHTETSVVVVISAWAPHTQQAAFSAQHTIARRWRKGPWTAI